MPARAFWAKYLKSCESNVACTFSKKMSQSALKQVLTLPDYRTQKMLQVPLKIIDLQNDFSILGRTMENSNYGPNVMY